jgi:hypothetical protein
MCPSALSGFRIRKATLDLIGPISAGGAGRQAAGGSCAGTAGGGQSWRQVESGGHALAGAAGLAGGADTGFWRADRGGRGGSD